MTKLGQSGILPLLRTKGVEPVSFNQWETLDEEERHRGKPQGRPREKITDVNEMLNIAKKSS